MVLFDRSWYNRAGVERVMGFCSEDDVEEFFRAAPEIERMLVRSGIVLIKYWLEVSAQEQRSRLMERVEDPTKQWKLSPIDAEAPAGATTTTRARWPTSSHRTDIPEAPWYVVDADDQKRARLNLIAHLLELLPQRRAPEVVKIHTPRRKAKPATLPESVARVPERW